MRFVVLSAFRNSAGGQITRWMDQIVNLRRELRQSHFCYLRAVAVEGDSKDATLVQLKSLAVKMAGLFEIDVVMCNHGGPVFGSTEDHARMAALSKVSNAMLDSVRGNDDIVIYVESDLIWEGSTISALIDHVLAGHSDVVAPLVFAGDNFYDVYAYRGLDGSRFSPFAPYHSSLRSNPLSSSLTGLVEVSSVGSCLVMRGGTARRVRIVNGDALVGWCGEARRLGYRISVAPELRIRHPA